MATTIEALADFVAGAANKPLPADVDDYARVVLLDTVVSALGGVPTTRGRMATALASTMAGPGPATILGSATGGTVGAVIKIRDPFPSRKALFDIAIGGPIGGFVVLVPLLFWGMHLSNVAPVPPAMGGYSLGEPMIFKLAMRLTFGAIPEGSSVNMHPVAFAAWFGMLATAWNLLPFGQLDGGHLTYATLGERARDVSLATIGFCIGMCFVSYSWIVMTLMMIAMLVILGPRHPRVLAEYEPLGPGRQALAIGALIMLIVCFTPTPIDPL